MFCFEVGFCFWEWNQGWRNWEDARISSLAAKHDWDKCLHSTLSTGRTFSNKSYRLEELKRVSLRNVLLDTVCQVNNSRGLFSFIFFFPSPGQKFFFSEYVDIFPLQKVNKFKMMFSDHSSSCGLVSFWLEGIHSVLWYSTWKLSTQTARRQHLSKNFYWAFESWGSEARFHLKIHWWIV